MSSAPRSSRRRNAELSALQFFWVHAPGLPLPRLSPLGPRVFGRVTAGFGGGIGGFRCASGVRRGSGGAGLERGAVRVPVWNVDVMAFQLARNVGGGSFQVGIDRLVETGRRG